MNVLILADFFRGAPGTILDHAHAFRKYSNYRTHYFNPVWKNIPSSLILDAYDVIVVHYSVFAIHEAYLNLGWRRALAASRSLKIQFIQDEYRNVDLVHRFQRECGIDVLYTCIPTPEIEKVYPEKKLPHLRKFNTLTGYVPDYFSNKLFFGHPERPIDLRFTTYDDG